MQGKVKEIRRIAGSQKPDLVFNYDGLGNRVSKTVIPKNSVNNEDSITTYYVRDVQGNILATYEKTKYKNGDEEFYLKEQYLYGSSRIGMNTSNLLLASNVNGNVEIKEYDGYFTKTVGNKRFELTNHLGNVLAVVSDKKGVDNEPDVVSVSDYYPFGMQMPGRLYSEPSNGYRFGFNGKENINEMRGWQDYGERMYNRLTGRFNSPDPLIAYGQQYPELSSYQFASNRPIDGIDLDGLEYLNANDARIEAVRGEIRLKIENFNFISRSMWRTANSNPNNWSYNANGQRDLGISRTIGSLQYTIPANSAPTVGLNADDTNPNANDAQHRVQNPTTKQSNYAQQDKRYKERSIAGGSNMRAPAAKGMLALDAANAMVEYGILGAGLYEQYKLDNNLGILMKAIKNVQDGISQGLVPEKYQNTNDLSSILNVVLQGESNSDNKELYNIGMNIYNTISNPPAPKQEDEK